MSTPVEHTFVILAYRESPYLEACIASILNQSVTSQVVIATSTPNDFIQDLASRHGLPVRINENGGSIGKDWNFGLECASTKYVTLAHQDDVYGHRFAEQCLAAARRHDNHKPLIVFTASTTYTDDQAVAIPLKNMLRWLLVFPFHLKRCISSARVRKSILLFSNSISCPGVCYVKDNLSTFHFDELPKYVLDWKAWFDMSQMNGSFVYVPEALHIHREHAKSATSTCPIAELQHEERTLLTAMWGNRWMPAIISTLLRLAK